MATELDLKIEEDYNRYTVAQAGTDAAQAEIDRFLSQTSKLPFPLRRLIQYLDQTRFSPRKTKKVLEELTQKQHVSQIAREDLDFDINGRAGTYQVTGVDLINLKPFYTRVHFIHVINGNPYLATHLSSFVQGQLAPEIGSRQTSTGLKPPTFSIRGNNHPLLRLPSNYPVNLFPTLDSKTSTPKRLPLTKVIERIHPYLLID